MMAGVLRPAAGAKPHLPFPGRQPDGFSLSEPEVKSQTRGDKAKKWAGRPCRGAGDDQRQQATCPKRTCSRLKRNRKAAGRFCLRARRGLNAAPGPTHQTICWAKSWNGAAVQGINQDRLLGLTRVRLAPKAAQVAALNRGGFAGRAAGQTFCMTAGATRSGAVDAAPLRRLIPFHARAASATHRPSPVTARAGIPVQGPKSLLARSFLAARLVAKDAAFTAVDHGYAAADPGQADPLVLLFLPPGGASRCQHGAEQRTRSGGYSEQIQLSLRGRW